MAHILFIYKQFPSPSVGHAGGESLFQLMAGLHRRGHRLSLVARILDEERDQLPAVDALCDHVHTVPHHRAMDGPPPLNVLRSYVSLRRAAARVIREQRPDLVHVETTQTAITLLGLRMPPASLRTQDVNWFLQEQRAARSAGLARLDARIKHALYRWLEPALYRRYALLLAISEGDRRLLAPTRPERPLLLVPLAPALHPDPAIAPAVAPGPTLLFVGAMYRDHNIAGATWFLDHVWPRVLREVPDARFYVVGNRPPPALRARAEGERVNVTGFVPDLAPWYRAAAIFVAPMLVAGGLLQKVVDAMAMGVPVVATSSCNHGLGATPGRHLITADAPEAFAAEVARLLRAPDARAAIGAAGQAFIRARYDPEAAIDRWDAALRELAEGTPPRVV